MKPQFNISMDVQKQMCDEIKRYFLKERDEELGDIGARAIFDFFTEKLARHFYNQGVSDAQKFLSERIEDLFEIHK